MRNSSVHFKIWSTGKYTCKPHSRGCPLQLCMIVAISMWTWYQGLAEVGLQKSFFRVTASHIIHYNFIRYTWLARMWSWYQELEEVGAKKVLWEQLGWGRSLGFSGYFILTLTFTLHHLGIFPCLVSRIARIQILSHVPSIFSIVRNLIIFMGREGVGVVVG